MSLLAVQGIVAGYGQTEILHGVSIVVEPGEIVAIIGPNGSGKSTLMKSAVGLLRPTGGSVNFRGEDITGVAPENIVRKGLCYVPQSSNVFPSLSIHENLEMGAFVRTDDYRPRITEIYDLFPDLASRRKERASRLSGGQRQMVALARALMLNPVLLLLDEPSAGLAPMMVASVFEKIKGISSTGVAVLMVEQNAREALRLSARGYVLAAGHNRLEGPGRSLLSDPEVARLYLGG
ncbi:MAG: ABC transporter ATP-binding protein [Dehalococcoidia bacterium]|nr:ABC transporter ATP-binding protein [Dehalococcoidia bacterium]